MCNLGQTRNNMICGVLLVLLLGLPVITDAKEATTTTDEKQSEAQQSTKDDSDVTFSDVMGWARRFGNRVGDNISEATGKTATAIKNAVSDNQPKSQSEDSP